jgi:biotin carboxyl carrier protein
MTGVVVALKVQAGNVVHEGEPVATLSAMKINIGHGHRRGETNLGDCG